MKLPRVRFTVRRMLFGVAVVAVAIGGTLNVYRLVRLRDEYRRQVENHAKEMEIWDLSESTSFYDGQYYYELDSNGNILRWCLPLKRIVGMREVPVEPPWIGGTNTWIEGTKGLPEEYRQEMIHRVLVYRAKTVYHTAMGKKYQRLAAYPWLPYEPDPPEPDM